MDYLTAALDMVNETTEPEAFAIRAAHAIAVEQDYEKAAQLYETILRKYPDATTLRNNLGAVYGVLGRHKDAVTEYREAIRAEPTLMTSYNGLVTEYLDHLGRVDLALVWLRRQMAYQPESALPYTNLAYAYVGADSLDKAAAALEQALVFDAEFSPGLELLGHLLWLEGRYDESLVMFARILAANPDAVEPHYYMGVVYQSKGAGTTALDHFDRFRRVSQWRTEDNPDNAGYFFDLGVVLTRMGQPTRSRAAGERAAEISPTAYFDLVRLYSVQGRADEAFELLDRAAGSGFRDFVTLKYHPDFKNLRNDPRLVRLLDAYLKV
jgi:tetratricopeptide (TPR) repeat protein